MGRTGFVGGSGSSALLGPLAMLLALTIAAGGTSAKLAVVPHDVYPGFEVMQFRQSPKHPSTYRLLETGFSKYFTVLENGMVMTTSDIGQLVNRPINLIVLEELANRTETHDLRLYVINRGNMLTFSHENLGEGSVTENSPAATPVDGFPIFHAFGDFPVHYTILPDENGERPFALVEQSSSSSGYNLTLKSHRQAVGVVTARPLDRETKSSYNVVIRASDGNDISTSKISGTVRVTDVNDNSPVFDQEEYNFEVRPENLDTLETDAAPRWKRFATVGRIAAKDADGDRVAYRLTTPTNLVIIVPQTGELLLAGEPDATANEDSEIEFMVEAHDVRTPSRSSERPARCVVRFLTTEPLMLPAPAPEVHRIQKRRVTRAVRPTMKVEFLESDGDVEGKIAFSLEKDAERETYKIRDENPWVNVAANGSVTVKQKWDYEELGPDKTIDFWVTITNAGGTAGKNYSRSLTNSFRILLLLYTLIRMVHKRFSFCFQFSLV